MKPKKDPRSEKIEELMEIISFLDDDRLDALLVLLKQKSLRPYGFKEPELLRVEEAFYRYETGASKGMSAQESVQKLTEHLKRIKKKK
jgi:hypothetical protein